MRIKMVLIELNKMNNHNRAVLSRRMIVIKRIIAKGGISPILMMRIVIEMIQHVIHVRMKQKKRFNK